MLQNACQFRKEFSMIHASGIGLRDNLKGTAVKLLRFVILALIPEDIGFACKKLCGLLLRGIRLRRNLDRLSVVFVSPYEVVADPGNLAETSKSECDGNGL